MVRTGGAPAKVNLGLRVLRKRADGYHDLETVFFGIGWQDTLRVSRTSRFTLEVQGMDLAADDSNLVTKAAHSLARHTRSALGAQIQLEKRIPIGAGLGGGSSDAAATLRLLSDLWNVSVSEAELNEIALGIGSDVPFFLGPPVAYATGRGEVLTPMPEYQLPYPLLVVIPPVSISTAWAFGQVTPRAKGTSNLKAVIESNDLALWRAEVVNDFEALVLKEEPVLAEAKEITLRCGAGYAALSGTGAAVYSIFEDLGAAEAAEEKARERGWRTWLELPP